jgi:hypothetical protein
VSRRFSVRRQLFRAGTLDGAVLISNGFLVQCPQNPASLSPAPCLNLAGSRTWVGFVLALHLISEFEKGFSYGGPRVRIRLPPAVSPSLSRIRFRRSRTPAFRAGVRGRLGDRVGRDAQSFPFPATRRQYLCRAILQYRSAADGVGEDATLVYRKPGLREVNWRAPGNAGGG